MRTQGVEHAAATGYDNRRNQNQAKEVKCPIQLRGIPAGMWRLRKEERREETGIRESDEREWEGREDEADGKKRKKKKANKKKQKDKTTEQCSREASYLIRPPREIKNSIENRRKVGIFH